MMTLIRGLDSGRGRQCAAAFLCALVAAGAGCGGRKLPALPKDDPKLYDSMVSAFTIASTALRVGDQKRAEATAPKPTELVPEEPAGWANLGLAYMRSTGAKAPDAEKALRKAQELAPNNARITELQGKLAEKQGKLADALAMMQKAVQQDPKDARARYSLVEILQRQPGPSSDKDQVGELSKILEITPDNLRAQLELALAASRAHDRASLANAVQKLGASSALWPANAGPYYKGLQDAANAGNAEQATVQAHFLLNTLKQTPAYQAGSAEIASQPSDISPPLERFILLPNPSPAPAAPDSGITFAAQPVDTGGVARPQAICAAILSPELPSETAREFGQELSGVPARPEGPAVTIAVTSREVRIVGGPSKVTLPFPGGASSPTADGILLADWSYHFRPDLVLAGAGGLRLYRQGEDSSFVDVTAVSKVPAAIVSAAYHGAWAADIEGDGGLDIVLGSKTGPAVVLHNNGDRTFTPATPFSGVNGLRRFLWADVTGDGDPDAVLIDGQYNLRVFENLRSGHFREIAQPAPGAKVLAAAVSDLDRDGTFDVIALQADGAIKALRFGQGPRSWTAIDLAQWPSPPQDGSTRLIVEDLDNNGAPDLIATGSGGTQVWLADANGRLAALGSPVSAVNVTPAPPTAQGRIDLVGLARGGGAVRLVNAGKQSYGWFILHARARFKAKQRPGEATGDQRINTFGVGGTAEVRAGLLTERARIAGASVHFGLGTYARADVVRVVWPNGVVQAEFDTGMPPQPLKTQTSLVAIERLIGSCPWLYAWDGKRVSFVTDVLFSSPLGLRINAQGTASSTTTRDWVKVRSDQLVPHDGCYDLRVTGELWETHFFDMVRLVTVDHPVGTDVLVDERFLIPPVKLQTHVMTRPKPVARAVDQAGRDVTDLVAARDGRYLDTFALGEYQGVARDHYVELELGPDARLDRPLWLVAEGWLHPTDSSINLAISQGKHDRPRPLSLEVSDGKGGWTTVRPDLGFPAGKNKTCLIDLTGLLKPGMPKKLRLRTNMEIYWDFIGCAEGLDGKVMVAEQTLRPSAAELRFHGFSVVTQASHSSPELPEYDQIWSTGQPWHDLVGFCTRFGDVRELTNKVDDRYVILNAGDEIALRFPVPAPPRAGWTRDFVFVSDGWEKDGNVNTGFSKTVLPLPSHADKAYSRPPTTLEADSVYRAHRQDWLTFQTRYVTPYAIEHALIPGR